jgi:hypothetical protein
MDRTSKGLIGLVVGLASTAFTWRYFIHDADKPLLVGGEFLVWLMPIGIIGGFGAVWEALTVSTPSRRVERRRSVADLEDQRRQESLPANVLKRLSMAYVRGLPDMREVRARHIADGTIAADAADPWPAVSPEQYRASVESLPLSTAEIDNHLRTLFDSGTITTGEYHSMLEALAFLSRQPVDQVAKSDSGQPRTTPE